MARLDGKIALIMGASRPQNMGQAIACRFITEGARVLVSGRSETELSRFAAATGAEALPCDITSKEQVFRLVERIVDGCGRLDIAVNAAATGIIADFEQTTEEELEEMISIIFRGGFFFMQAAVAAMKRAGGGAIVNVTSAVATIMFENHAAYMGAKAGLEHVTRAVANDHGRFGIKANIVAPGLTATPMTENYITSGLDRAFIDEIPLGRLNTVEDVANAVLFAVSDECFMTGQTFHVTGGLTLRRNPTAAEIGAVIGSGE